VITLILTKEKIMAEPVALGIKPPTPMSLGDMLNIARGAQAYQQAEQLNPLAAQKAQMEIEQLQKTNPLAVRQQAALATTAETGATKGQAELQAYYKDQARKTFGGLLTDKDFDPLNPNPEGIKAKLQEAGDYLTNVLGVPEHESKAQAKLLEHIDKHGVAGAQRVIQQIANGVQQAGTPSEQFAQANRAPTAIGTGSSTILYPSSPYQKNQTVAEFQQQLGPNQIYEPTGRVDANNEPTAYIKDKSGRILGEVAIPAGVQANNVVGKTPNRLPAFENSETVAKARADQLAIQNAAKGVQSSQFNNNTSINLADKALVGANAETLAKFGGGFAIMDAVGTGSATAVDNRQKLGHILAQETVNLSSSAGLSTDSARSLSSQVSGDIQWTPEAIKSTARTNRALSTGADMLNRGMTIAIKNANNNPIAGRDFQNKWSTQEQLLPTLQFVDALRNAKSDPEGAKKMIDSVGGYGSQGYKDMLKRAGGLNDLITKGQ
jgi:hypothetical protein